VSQTLLRRIDSLERRIEALESLPPRLAHLELQLVHLRHEVRNEVSAVRDQLRAEIKAGDKETRHLMRVLHEDLIERLKVIQEGQRSLQTAAVGSAREAESPPWRRR
jgi:hypothetical protein